MCLCFPRRNKLVAIRPKSLYYKFELRPTPSLMQIFVKMAPWVKAPAAKPDDLNSVPGGTLRVGRTDSSKSPAALHGHTHIPNKHFN